MRLGRPAALLLIVACLTAGCKSPPQIYKGARTARDEILVPTPAVMPFPNLVVIGDFMGVLPVIGMGRMAILDVYGEHIGAEMAKEGFDLPGEFRDSLASELKKLGPTPVSTLSVTRAKATIANLWPNELELPVGASSACFVDVLLVYGFVAPVTGASYEPYVAVNLKVVRGDDHYVTYAEKFFYNFVGRDIEIEPTTPLPSWHTPPSIQSDIKGARDGFRSAIADLAKFVSSHLQTHDHLGKC